MIWLLMFLCAAPVPVEAWPERKGETARSKRKDAIWLIVYALALSLLGWLFVYVMPLKTIALILGFRILSFDYLIHALLKRYSPGHKDINIWTFSGTTAVTDQIISKVPPVVRLSVRGILFAASLIWYL